MAVVSGVKSLSDADRAQALEGHRPAQEGHQPPPARHQGESEGYVRRAGDDDDEVDDLALIESDEGDMGKAFLADIQQLAREAAGLATRLSWRGSSSDCDSPNVDRAGSTTLDHHSLDHLRGEQNCMYIWRESMYCLAAWILRASK
jgi:hypothetical protein